MDPQRLVGDQALQVAVLDGLHHATAPFEVVHDLDDPPGKLVLEVALHPSQLFVAPLRGRPRGVPALSDDLQAKPVEHLRLAGWRRPFAPEFAHAAVADINQVLHRVAVRTVGLNDELLTIPRQKTKDVEVRHPPPHRLAPGRLKFLRRAQQVRE